MELITLQALVDEFQKIAALTPEEQAAFKDVVRQQSHFEQRSASPDYTDAERVQHRHNTDRMQHYINKKKSDDYKIPDWARDPKGVKPEGRQSGGFYGGGPRTNYDGTPYGGSYKTPPGAGTPPPRPSSSAGGAPPPRPSSSAGGAGSSSSSHYWGGHAPYSDEGWDHFWGNPPGTRAKDNARRAQDAREAAGGGAGAPPPPPPRSSAGGSYSSGGGTGERPPAGAPPPRPKASPPPGASSSGVPPRDESWAGGVRDRWQNNPHEPHSDDWWDHIAGKPQGTSAKERAERNARHQSRMRDIDEKFKADTKATHARWAADDAAHELSAKKNVGATLGMMGGGVAGAVGGSALNSYLDRRAKEQGHGPSGVRQAVVGVGAPVAGAIGGAFLGRHLAGR